MARRNTGSVKQKRPGVFMVTLDISQARRPTTRDWKEAVGRLRRSVTVEGTREDAERKLHEMQVEADTGAMPTTDVTLNALLDWWLEAVVRPEHKTATWETYRRHCRLYIRPALGSMKIADIQPHHVRQFQNRMLEKLAPVTVKLSRQVLNQAMEDARRNRLIPENPATYREVKGPKEKRPTVTPPSLDVAQKFLADSKTDGHRFAALYHVLAYTGIRISEALGLTWEDVDVLDKWLLIRNPMEHTDTYGLRHGTPKSESSNRQVPIDAGTIDVLMAHRTTQEARREAVGERWDEDDLGLVFPNTTGGFLHRAQPERDMKRYGANLTPHKLRHFYATMIVEKTSRIDLARDLLGHSSMATTGRYYLHPTDKGKRTAVEALVDLLAVPNGNALAPKELEALLSDTEI